MRIGRTRTRAGPDLGPDSGTTMVSVSPCEARAAVAEAVETRRARPALTVPLDLAVTRTDTSSGLALGALGLLGGGAGHALGLVVAWLSVPQDIRAIRHHNRVARISRQFCKASERSQPGSGHVQRISAFRRTIVEGSTYMAALGVCMLYRELAGDDATAEEFIQRRSPVWPAWSYHLAISTERRGDVELAREHLEQTFATAHPVWATAAAIGLLDRLHETRDSERVASLTEWIERRGDSAVVIELLFYR
jgi:hypothetical protein